MSIIGKTRLRAGDILKYYSGALIVVSTHCGNKRDVDHAKASTGPWPNSGVWSIPVNLFMDDSIMLSKDIYE